MSDRHAGLAKVRLVIARRFGIGGARWVVTRPDAAGAIATIATVEPLYVRQIQPSQLEQSMAQSATALRARYTCVAPASAATALTVGDTITSAANGSLTFLVTGLDRIETPGLAQGTLQKQVFT